MNECFILRIIQEPDKKTKVTLFSLSKGEENIETDEIKGQLKNSELYTPLHERLTILNHYLAKGFRFVGITSTKETNNVETVDYYLVSPGKK